jgi:N-acetylglutamate synthase-like GNAT family acetyltransferase
MILRRADKTDLGRIAAFYRAMGYHGGFLASDLVLLVEDGRVIVGVVRLCEEENELVLRGMYVKEEHQRRGLGTRMLDGLDLSRETRRCWCVPFEHLTGFYARAGFEPADVDKAPRFLRDRLAGYRRRGMDVTLMVRSSGAGPHS